MAKISRRWPRLEYIVDQMLRNGIPAKREMNGRDYRMGPILVTSSKAIRTDAIRLRYGKQMQNANAENVTIVVLKGKDEPGTTQGLDVVMSLEGLVQILTWLVQGDPSNFLRPTANKGMKE